MPRTRSWSTSSWRSRRGRPVGFVPSSRVLRTPRSTIVGLEKALGALAAAAFDLRKDVRQGGVLTLADLKMPMLWNYQVVGACSAGESQTSRWPDGTPGRTYHPVVIEVDNECANSPYADEDSFNLLPPDARSFFRYTVRLNT